MLHSVSDDVDSTDRENSTDEKPEPTDNEDPDTTSNDKDTDEPSESDHTELWYLFIITIGNYLTCQAPTLHSFLDLLSVIYNMMMSSPQSPKISQLDFFSKELTLNFFLSYFYVPRIIAPVCSQWMNVGIVYWIVIL